MSHDHHHQQHQQEYENIDAQTRVSYERFLEFERLMKMYPPSSSQNFNSTPLGLCAFALTTFILSMYNAGVAVPVTTPHGIVMCLALFYGGLIQLLAGLLEFRVGNNFGALAFCSYGDFWLGLASLYVQSFNFLGNYSSDVQEKALGALVALFFFLTLTFLLLTASKFQLGHLNLQRAVDAFGIITASIAWYAAFASLLKRGVNSYFSLPVYNLAPDSPLIIIDESSTNIRTQKI
ncbi:unnamed protein product [Rotaria sp. Silwood1]|nr:unnamed protein product [Rotaria sp. Silwood1]CAF4843567.1 unnamed protein product [Rotaria sp. Silwood1]